jgi:hypothetical protein
VRRKENNKCLRYSLTNEEPDEQEESAFFVNIVTDELSSRISFLEDLVFQSNNIDENW